jgi:NAD dependent epimerase/dehydratase family enzyme
VEAINAAPKELKPKVLVSSTAIGYYGTSESSAFDEASPSGKDYLAEVRNMTVNAVCVLEEDHCCRAEPSVSL